MISLSDSIISKSRTLFGVKYTVKGNEAIIVCGQRWDRYISCLVSYHLCYNKVRGNPCDLLVEESHIMSMISCLCFESSILWKWTAWELVICYGSPLTRHGNEAGAPHNIITHYVTCICFEPSILLKWSTWDLEICYVSPLLLCKLLYYSLHNI